MIHYENLHLEAMVKTKKIHPLLEFNQSQWLKQYIEFNTHTKKEYKQKKWRQGWRSIVQIN